MNPTDYDKALLVHHLWHNEAHDNSLQGLQTAAHVIKNRVDSGWGNWRQMILDAGRWAGNEPVTRREPPNNYNPIFRKLLSEIDGIMDGSTLDEMTRVKTYEGKEVMALYFADLAHPITNFLKEKILGDPANHKRIATVGTLTLFL